jgi:hypothetical protein
LVVVKVLTLVRAPALEVLVVAAAEDPIINRQERALLVKEIMEAPIVQEQQIILVPVVAALVLLVVLRPQFQIQAELVALVYNHLYLEHQHIMQAVAVAVSYFLARPHLVLVAQEVLEAAAQAVILLLVPVVR